MIVYRIAKARYREDRSGRGASLFGGRWNSKGTPALYASTHLSLAVLEIIAQARRPHIVDEGAWVLTLEVPDEVGLYEVEPESLPQNWRAPARASATQQLGDRQFGQGAFGLLVPSAVLPIEWNVVLNPLHSDYPSILRLGCEPLDLDARAAVVR